MRTGITASALAGQPCIRGVLPDSGGPGSTIYIKGTGLASVQGTVGGLASPWITTGDTMLTVRIGAAMQNGNIVLTNAKSGKSATASFTLLPAQIVSITPLDGRAGDRIVINGLGFSNQMAGVTFRDGHNPAASEQVDGTGTLVNAIVPPGDVTGHIYVSGLVSAQEFVELPTFDAPTTDAIIPPGGSVILTGKALQNVTSVTVGSADAPIVSKSYMNLSFTPSGTQSYQSSASLGKATVNFRRGGGGSGQVLAGPNITVRVPPQITKIQPDSGTACDQANVLGVGLIDAPSGNNGSPIVSIGAVQSPYASGSNTNVSFFVPKGATTGPLTVRGYSEQVTSATPFRIVPPQPTAYPQGATVGSVGTTLQFVGRLLEVTKVTFTGGVVLTQGWTVSPIYNDGSCQDALQIKIPAGATTGAITFTNPRGSVSDYVTVN